MCNQISRIFIKLLSLTNKKSQDSFQYYFKIYEMPLNLVGIKMYL